MRKAKDGGLEENREAAGVTQQEAESSHIDPDPDGAPHPPKMKCPLWSLPGPGALVTPGWGLRFGEGDARPLTTCPPPAPALGLTSLRGEQEREPVGRPASHLGSQPAPGPETGTAWGPGAAGGRGAGCRLGLISVPLPVKTSAGGAGHRVRSPAQSRDPRHLDLISNPLPLLYRW